MQKFELPLKTYEDRKNYIKALGERLGTDITVKEWFVIIHQWTMYEITLVRVEKAERRLGKWRDKLNTTFAVLDFRQDLDDPRL